MHYRMLCIVVPMSLVGCATITGNEMQSLSVTTAKKDKTAVEQAHCSLHNDKGVWEVTSPGFVMVHRSAGDLDVVCKKDGEPDGLLKAVSRAGGGMWGNIIFGGGVGAIIDHEKGTGYNYPDKLAVVMGSSIVEDRADENKPTQPDDSTSGK